MIVGKNDSRTAEDNLLPDIVPIGSRPARAEHQKYEMMSKLVSNDFMTAYMLLSVLSNL